MNDSRVRVHIVGVVVAALFCSLLARLWFLQISEKPVAVDLTNSESRLIHTLTSRGLIFDSAGRLLVGNRISWAITADAKLRAASHDSTLRNVVPVVAKLLGKSVQEITHQLDERVLGPLESVVLAADVNRVVQRTVVERAEEFPHVTLAAIELRWYAKPSIAPQVLGYLGQVSQDDLLRHIDYDPNELIGRSGLESVYQASLRGGPTTERVAVDATGQVVGDPAPVAAGRPGFNVHLTVDSDLQAFAQQALEEGMRVARTEYNEDLKAYGQFYRATTGAVVIVDTRDGSLKTVASSPGYNNTDTLGQFSALNSKANHTPLLNHATQELYAPGSTFKLVSAVASVNTGTFPAYLPVAQGDGCLLRPGFKICQPDKSGPPVDLQRALTVSSDIYFYKVGDALWTRWKQGDHKAGYAIQTAARLFGFGKRTGVDADETSGSVPDEVWKRKLAHALYPKDAVAEDANNDWNPGDNIGLAVGQGGLLVSPLQLANAYAALANDGTVWRPRLVDSVTDAQGNAVESKLTAPKANSHVDFGGIRDVLMNGFAGVVTDPKGTAFDAFQGIPASIGAIRGKTGTAQAGNKDVDKTTKQPLCIKTVNGVSNFKDCLGDTSWFVSMYAPAGTDQVHPQYVILAMVQEGGRGGRIAAPIVRQIIEHMNHLTPTPIRQLTAGAPVAGARG